MDNEFSVAIFFPDDTYIYERRFVSAEEAVACAHACTLRPAATIGMIRRVIITDGGDCCNFEWQFGKGVTYPKKEDLHGQED